LDFKFVTETWWDSKNRAGCGILQHSLGPQDTLSDNKHYGTCVLATRSQNKGMYLGQLLKLGPSGNAQCRYQHVKVCTATLSEVVQFRWKELTARWHVKIRDRSDNHLVTIAKNESSNFLKTCSSFASIGKKEIVQHLDKSKDPKKKVTDC
jgi:hypothetical protein